MKTLFRFGPAAGTYKVIHECNLIKLPVKLAQPPLALGDNALMVASAGVAEYRREQSSADVSAILREHDADAVFGFVGMVS